MGHADPQETVKPARVGGPRFEWSGEADEGPPASMPDEARSAGLHLAGVLSEGATLVHNAVAEVTARLADRAPGRSSGFGRST